MEAVYDKVLVQRLSCFFHSRVIFSQCGVGSGCSVWLRLSDMLFEAVSGRIVVCQCNGVGRGGLPFMPLLRVWAGGSLARGAGLGPSVYINKQARKLILQLHITPGTKRHFLYINES